MRLVWNAIVKNEVERIERCVNSLMAHVDGAVVLDTGSTDSTPQKIQELFTAAGKPVEIHYAEFKDFAQARNAALAAARNSTLPWQYLLLVDADMELVADKPNWFNGANGLSYDMQQTAGDVTYWNRRLLSRQATGNYVGATHEYLDVPSAGSIDSARFVDHADGANRVDKFTRDIALLEDALKTETNQGLIGRYYFYLAQSFFDQGEWTKAAEYYKKRVEHGGWDEEVWNAKVHYAHCLGNLGDHPGFVWHLLEAYEMRPQRAESLYDLAKYFRELDHANFRSVLFSEPGLALARPDDKLFVNDQVYRTGLREEFSICAYYDQQRRNRGAAICNELALDKNGTEQSREQARANLYWYLQPLQAHVPSFTMHKIDFQAPVGYAPLNPSIINHRGRLLALIRTVNYEIREDGRYVSRDGHPFTGDSIIRTRNFLARLRDHGEVEHQVELQLPGDFPAPKFELVRGFEDSRLFENGQLWTLSTVRELTPEGWCEQVLAPIADYGNWTGYVDWKRVIPQGPKQNEKNWMCWVRNGEMQFVYRLGTIIDTAGMVVAHHEPQLSVGHISGGTQVVEIAPEVYLAVVHEARNIPGRVNRYYQHRFALLNPDGSLLSLSVPFYFQDRQIEFAAGLALLPGGEELVISFGIRDQEAWLGTLRIDDVLRFCP